MAEQLLCLCGRWFIPKTKRQKRLTICPSCNEAAKFVLTGDRYRKRNPVEQIQDSIRRTGLAIGRIKNEPLVYLREHWPTVRRELMDAKHSLYRAQVDLRTATMFLKTYGREFWRMDDFRAQVRELVNELPKAASVDAENEWVYGSLQEDSPDFSQAPSIGACNTWILCHTHIDMEKEFLRMLWRTRQPQAKTKQSQFKADQVDSAKQADDQSDAEMMETLFPKDSEK